MDEYHWPLNCRNEDLFNKWYRNQQHRVPTDKGFGIDKIIKGLPRKLQKINKKTAETGHNQKGNTIRSCHK